MSDVAAHSRTDGYPGNDRDRTEAHMKVACLKLHESARDSGKSRRCLAVGLADIIIW